MVAEPAEVVLHKTISAIRAETWERVNRALLASAGAEKLERGRVVRLDSTVTAALVHEPSDSSLLWDAVRVMVRLLRAADALRGRTGVWWRDHRRAAKKRARAIQFTQGRPRRVQLYRELIKTTRVTLAHLHQAAAQLVTPANLAVELWQAKVRHYEPLIERIIAQTERRVLAGEPVAAGDKLVSLFEPHADIIVKGSREVEYGHKLNLTTGQSGLILDLVVEAGNPADSERLLPMLERHIARHGEAPRQLAADGGFATRANLSQAKARGVRDLAFHKKRGLRIEDMVRSRWVYRKLRNFRAGIEADISCLKRAYGLARCTCAASTTSRPTSGPPSSPTTSLLRAPQARLSLPARTPPTRSHAAGAITHASTSLKPILHAPQQPHDLRRKLPTAPQYAQYAVPSPKAGSISSVYGRTLD